jgi:hypothetical protein
MPATRKHTAWGFRRRAALANMVIRAAVLPAQRSAGREVSATRRREHMRHVKLRVFAR